MKFNFMLSEDAMFEEGVLNESTSYVYIDGAHECIEHIKNHMGANRHTRGNGVLCGTLISMWNAKFGTSYKSTNFLVHHEDGNHFNNDYKNLCLIEPIKKGAINNLNKCADELDNATPKASGTNSKNINPHINIHKNLVFNVMCAFAHYKGLKPGATLSVALFPPTMPVADLDVLVEIYKTVAQKRTERESYKNTILYVRDLI